MVNQVSSEADLRERGRGAKFTLITQKLFGVIKSIRYRINQPKPAAVFLTYQTTERLREYLIEFEQKKSKAIARSCQIRNRAL